MEKIKKVSVTITKERAYIAIQRFMKENNVDYNHCIQLLKEASRNDRRPKQKQMALAVLKQILI